jgi:hypothetical protein
VPRNIEELFAAPPAPAAPERTGRAQPRRHRRPGLLPRGCGGAPPDAPGSLRPRRLRVPGRPGIHLPAGPRRDPRRDGLPVPPRPRPQARFGGFGDADRGALHLRYARWLQGRVARRGPQESCVGHHLGEAAVRLGPADPDVRGLGEEAAQLLLSAARRIRRTDREEARSLLCKASDLAPATDPLLIDIRLERGRVLFEQRKLSGRSWRWRARCGWRRAAERPPGPGSRVCCCGGCRSSAGRRTSRAVRWQMPQTCSGRTGGGRPPARRARAADPGLRPPRPRPLRRRQGSLAEALALIADDDDLKPLFRSVRREQVSLTRWGPESVAESIRRVRELLDAADADKDCIGSCWPNSPS